jgi:hypothetical protein
MAELFHQVYWVAPQMNWAYPSIIDYW